MEKKELATQIKKCLSVLGDISQVDTDSRDDAVRFYLFSTQFQIYESLDCWEVDGTLLRGTDFSRLVGSIVKKYLPNQSDHIADRIIALGNRIVNIETLIK